MNPLKKIKLLVISYQTVLDPTEEYYRGRNENIDKFFWKYTIKKIIIFILYSRFGSKIWPILLIIDLSNIFIRNLMFFYNE